MAIHLIFGLLKFVEYNAIWYRQGYFAQKSWFWCLFKGFFPIGRGHLLQAMDGVMRLVVQFSCCLLGVYGLQECITSQEFNVLFLYLVLAL